MSNLVPISTPQKPLFLLILQYFTYLAVVSSSLPYNFYSNSLNADSPLSVALTTYALIKPTLTEGPVLNTWLGPDQIFPIVCHTVATL